MLELIPMEFNHHEVHVIFDTHGNPWWPASGPCAILGLGNVSRVLARLDDDEKRQITLSDVAGVPQKIWCINESGLYHLILSSRMPQAKAFRRWLTQEVLPQLRKTGRYQLTPDRFLANTERPTQVQNSRDVGALQSAFGGRNDAIRWFRTSLKEITGHYPKEWKNLGMEQHLPGKVVRRGREVVRALQPAGACATSLADELLLHRVNESEAIDIGQQSIALFQRIIDAGVRPAELDAVPVVRKSDED